MVESSRKYNRIVQVGFQTKCALMDFLPEDNIKSGKLVNIGHVKSYNMLGGNKWEAKANTK